MKNNNILIADSNPITNIGIKAILLNNFANVNIETPENYLELINKLKTKNYDILFVDVFCFNDFVLPLTQNLIKYISSNNIIVFTGNLFVNDIITIVNNGYKRIISKQSSIKTIINSINSVDTTNKFYSDEVFELLVSSNIHKKIVDFHLTKKETEIVKFISSGLTTNEIAEKLFLSKHTVVTHRKNIFKKLNIKNTSELIMFAIKSRLIDTTEYYI